MRAAISPGTIILSLACIAAPLRNAGCEVRILDLNLERKPEPALRDALTVFRPEYIGFTFTTAIFHLAQRYAKVARAVLPTARLVCGGPHATHLAEEVLQQTEFDIVVRGEGDETIVDIVTGKDLGKIPGIVFKDGDRITRTLPRAMIPEIDTLPFPALDLYDVRRYVHPKIVAKRNPVASMETSRGCYAACTFCDKRRSKYRVKSAERVVDEMKHILSLGFREIHLVDDMFTADLRRAKEICRSIIRSGLDVSWYPRGGIRVDRVDEEIFVLMKQAGVWHVAFGVESGVQEVLDAVQKQITPDKIRRAITLARKAGLETEGYFMLGLPGDTAETIEETVRFSTSLDLDYAKYAITVPLPGTPLFDDWDRAGVIKTKDWSKLQFERVPALGAEWRSIA